MKHLPIVLFSVALSGCVALPGPQVAPPPSEGTVDATSIAVAPPPPPSARTAEQFDTTTKAQRDVAAAVSSGGAGLGPTVASLGDLSVPGFWAETPLVDVVTMGRLVYPSNGKSVGVELRPIGGDDGAGSRVSLAAFRALEVPLTDLPTLNVFAN